MSPAYATAPSPSQISVISRLAGGSPLGKSISGLSVLMLAPPSDGGTHATGAERLVRARHDTPESRGRGRMGRIPVECEGLSFPLRAWARSRSGSRVALCHDGP